MDDTELRISGIEALSKVLGPAAALRFLTLLHREPTDYVETSRWLYAICQKSGWRSSRSDSRSLADFGSLPSY